MEIPKYNKLYALGHRYTVGILDDVVQVEEKLDGSQISFAKLKGELHIRSKSAIINVDYPEKMFGLAVESIKSRFDKMIEGFIYRGEYLQKPRHNVLAYNRTPEGHIAIYDIEDMAIGDVCKDRSTKVIRANDIGLECVPLLNILPPQSKEEVQPFLKALLDTQSFLGGQKIEGIVIKNYYKFDVESRPLMAKYVSEAFKAFNQTAYEKGFNDAINDRKIVTDTDIKDFRKAEIRRIAEQIFVHPACESVNSAVGIARAFYDNFDAEFERLENESK
jgi:hypothetical protein